MPRSKIENSEFLKKIPVRQHTLLQGFLKQTFLWFPKLNTILDRVTLSRIKLAQEQQCMDGITPKLRLHEAAYA